APVIEKWVPHLATIVGEPDEETYFVGHSVGCQTILRYLETVHAPVGGAVLVAGWFGLKNLEDEETEEIARPWLTTPIDFEKVKAVLPRSTLIISDNDPYESFEYNKERFTELGSKILVLPGAGHFTEDEGFEELPAALEAVVSLEG
ncbi:MAG TPA: alpha/beta hydrolase, partial [Candidatus Paceibacterota bacterium]|nr:alpha/beta hydrolase [Candidatus Paceibacterota bacterium]